MFFMSVMYITVVDSAANSRGATGAVCPRPPVEGGPQAVPVSVTFQSRFFKGFVSLYLCLKSTCSFAFCFMLLMLRSLLARAPYVVFSICMKPLIEDGNLQCTVCMHEKEPKKPPEHTSEHVKSQDLLGACHHFLYSP